MPTNKLAYAIGLIGKTNQETDCTVIKMYEMPMKKDNRKINKSSDVIMSDNGHKLFAEIVDIVDTFKFEKRRQSQAGLLSENCLCIQYVIIK